MEIAIIILGVVALIEAGGLVSLYRSSVAQQDKFTDVLIAERAPRYTQIAQTEKLAARVAEMSEVETDDEDDLPDGMVN